MDQINWNKAEPLSSNGVLPSAWTRPDGVAQFKPNPAWTFAPNTPSTNPPTANSLIVFFMVGSLG